MTTIRLALGFGATGFLIAAVLGFVCWLTADELSPRQPWRAAVQYACFAFTVSWVSALFGLALGVIGWAVGA